MIVLVPSTIALLPAYAGLEDPVAPLRAATGRAVSALVAAHPEDIGLVAAPARPDNAARGVVTAGGERVGRALLSAAGFAGGVTGEAAGVLVVANGSACRSEKAPGHLDAHAAAFDGALGRALRFGDGRALAGLDEGLAEQLWCFDAPAFRALGRLVDGRAGTVTYEDDPYGVQYWVVTWG